MCATPLGKSSSSPHGLPGVHVVLCYDFSTQTVPAVAWILTGIQHVYGAQHPPFDPLLHSTLLKSTPKVPTTPVKAKRVSTFQEFESNTSDAWDAGEDDDELLAMAAQSLNTEVVMETAHRVLRNHSQQQGRPAPQQVPTPEPELQPVAEPPPALIGDLRLVKSVSESHTSCAAESASDPVPLQRSQSLPHSATVTLGGMPEPSTLGSSALSEREASRLDKFKQLLAEPNTDLGNQLAAVGPGGILRRKPSPTALSLLTPEQEALPSLREGPALIMLQVPTGASG
ncbi:TBC1 domain family member 22A [Heterocephalus glaber]|uniref:TBC1 domain family member 22A n=1 Tax=Heterocephalus glaber TaxID=10181 RepID=G5BVB7_HETGA|nr:TBC1 domain family member 22A [Heterocephalus glaber]